VSQNANLANASLLKKRIKLFENLEENIFIYADCSMIDTILRNLISNAIKFSYFDSLIHVSAHKKGQMVEIQVEDKGVGMTEEQVNQLFIPGLSQSLAGTDDERGTGFGLLMVYEFVKLNKGMIDVISEPNHGSRFILSFPAYG
jgi:signal transduction histidine kinase